MGTGSEPAAQPSVGGERLARGGVQPSGYDMGLDGQGPQGLTSRLGVVEGERSDAVRADDPRQREEVVVEVVVGLTGLVA